MAKTAMVRARMEPGLKRNVEGILNEIGLDPSDFIRMVYKLVVQYQGLPFPVRIPNPETRRAIQEARRGGGKAYRTPQEFFDHLGI